MQDKAQDITSLLTSWRGGDRNALDRLLPLIQGSYTELRDPTWRRAQRPFHAAVFAGAGSLPPALAAVGLFASLLGFENQGQFRRGEDNTGGRESGSTGGNRGLQLGEDHVLTILHAILITCHGREAPMRSLCLILTTALALAAQVDPEYIIPRQNPFTTSADRKSGGQLFHGQCGRCHGPKGEGGLGAILAQPRLRHAPDDESLFKVIRDGVKGTEMPAASTLSSREIWQLAGYVRSLGQLPVETVPGDPQRGQEIYRTKGKCSQCHILNGQGESVGPELSDIGVRRNARYLRESLVEPEAAVPDGFLQVRIVTRDGRSIVGVRLNEDTFTIQLRDLNGRIYSFFKQDLKDLQKDFGKSPMPSYQRVLTPAELDDLVAYLVSLRGNP